MRNIFRYFITAIFAAAVFGGIGAVKADAQPIRDVLNRMDKHFKALQTLQAGVSRRQANPQVGSAPENSSGNLVLVPGKKGRDDVALRLNWTKPKEETLLVYRGNYQLYVPSIQTSYEGNTRSQKLGESGGGVLSLMTMSEADLKANYAAIYEGKETLNGKDVWHIRLDPKTKKNFKHAELWIDTDGMPIQATIVMPNSETDTFQFSGVRRNEKVDMKKAFSKIKTPSGTKVVNQ